MNIIRSSPQPEASKTIQQRFEEFHRLNPWVYDALEELTIDYLAHGQRKVGIRMLWEVVRWQHNKRTQDPSSNFKVNDHYHSRYVRLLKANHPEWDDVFEERKIRAA